jgi:signal transduction histidine kinase
VWTIRARLTAWYSGVVVAVLVTGAIAVTVVSDRLGADRLDRELDRLLLTLEGVMRTEFTKGLDLNAAAAEASGEVVAPDRTLALTTAEGKRLALWGLPLSAEWHAPPADAIETIVVGRARLRMVSHRVEAHGHIYIASVLAPLAGLETEHAALLRALTFGVLAALIVAAIGGWVVGRQTLRPLSDMAEQALAITDDKPSGRLRTPHKRDELGRLAQAFNAVLDRLAAGLHAQRQFMADASHEIRTPVSVVRTTAQVLLARESRPEQDYREALTIVAEQSARMAQLVDNMFLLSRAEASGIPLVREPVYLDDLLSESARALRVLADQRDVRVDVSGDTEVAFAGDDGLLRQMMTNLIENGIRHAKSKGTVAATITRTPAAATIAVEDDGDGVPEPDRERIFQRFVRLDRSRGGAGLGLPIAKWIAEAHHGRLELAPTNGRGARFVVTLPLA